MELVQIGRDGEQSCGWRSEQTDTEDWIGGTWKVTTDGTKEPKSRLTVRGDQEEKSLLLEKCAPTALKAACNFVLCIINSHSCEPLKVDIKKACLQSQRTKCDVYEQPPFEAQILKTH